MTTFFSQTAEIELLTVEKRRLEYSIQATEGPLHIARDCLGNRQRRIDYDLVQDQAEKELLKEIELISGVQVRGRSGGITAEAFSS